MAFHWTLAMLVLACTVSLGSGAFVITAPKQPYYDSEYTVSVSAHEMHWPAKVTLTYLYPKGTNKTMSKTLTFTKDGVQTWGVTFDSDLMAQKRTERVLLRVTGASRQGSTFLEFSDKTGYIFIQTDKPLYTPGQKVKFRIIALDEYQRLAARYPLKVDIKNPNSIVVDRRRYTAHEAFKAQEVDLPREAIFGNWTITATYEGLGGLTNHIYSKLFEVREYVLPRFTTTVDVLPKIITDETEEVTVHITSKYITGVFVRGIAEVTLGVLSQSSKEPPWFYESFIEKLEIGKVDLTLNVSNMIHEAFVTEDQKRLYVNVTVYESGTMEIDNVEDDSTLITKPFHTASFEGSRIHFKPGFNYTVLGRVEDATGNAANALNLVMDITFRDVKDTVINSLSAIVNVDKYGNFKNEFQTPSSGHNLKIKVAAEKDTGLNIRGGDLIVQKFPNKEKQYLQISIKKSITKKDDGIIHLQYTKPEANNMIVTVLVLSRGHLLYVESDVRKADGVSLISLPSMIYTEVLPSMRIVAYYYHSESQTTVLDSFNVFMKEECKKNLYLSKHFRQMGPLSPKEQLNLFVNGEPEMYIGLAAVDKAVFALSDDNRLTKKSMIELFASHDQGIPNEDPSKFSKSSGLVQLLLKDVSLARTRVLPNYLSEPIEKKHQEQAIMKHTQDVALHEPLVVVAKEEKKPKILRRYFPESFLFEEHFLTSRRPLRIPVTLPDSLTTWSIMAVGVSLELTGGMCVTRPVEQVVQKLFYAEIRFPYKVTRLEEVKVKVIVFNRHSYTVNATVAITGTKDLCFSSNEGTNRTHFSVKMNAQSSMSHIIKVIPLQSGHPNITVDVQSANARDIVERQLYVVAEGQKMRKTVTFVLDPKARHATFGKSKKKKTTLVNTKTLKSMFYNQRKQRTKINLAMPKEYIKGTESCKISAFGDIMGDVINYAVVKSKSLMDFSLSDAEEVIGDLGPTVHVLLYANKTGLITEELRIKGQQFIKHSIVRLLNYHEDAAFRLNTKSPKATWLTAITLKTLCHAAPLAFIDKKSLIIDGFEWLMNQVDSNGTLLEKDWRLAKDSQDYKIMLSAEALIATAECDQIDTESEALLELQAHMAFYLEDNLEQIGDVMVLAKVAYALTLWDEEAEYTTHAVEKLNSTMKTNNKGHLFWANETVTNEKNRIPFWYHKGAKASSIEATAFALLVYLQHGGQNIDAIADWLVTQRNHQGVFVGALDSMAAIQALAVYSARKHGVEVNMSCKLQANKMKEFSHSFTFNEKDAIHPKSLSNVPVGDVIQVITKGQGLGQMHVNVEYNIPVDKNAACRYNVSIQVKHRQMKYDPSLISHPLCMYCDVNCPEPEVEEGPDFTDTFEYLNMTYNETIINSQANDSSVKSLVLLPSPTLNLNMQSQLSKAEKILSLEKEINLISNGKRTKRDITYSTEILCIQVCIQYLDDLLDGDTIIEIEMLTGYEPIPSDISRLVENDGIKSSNYKNDTGSIFVRYGQLANGSNCFTFRVAKEEDVRKPTPAKVFIKGFEDPEPSCVVEYYAPTGKSLHLFCANPSNSNRGECRCYSGLCSKCMPCKYGELNLQKTHELVCSADIGYQVHLSDIKSIGSWVEYSASVLSWNKTNTSHKPKSKIFLTSPGACSCPHMFAMRNKPLYLLTKGPERMMDQNGNSVHRYLLDEKSVFLSVKPQIGGTSKYPQLHYYAMEYAFNKQDQCKK